MLRIIEHWDPFDALAHSRIYLLDEQKWKVVQEELGKSLGMRVKIPLSMCSESIVLVGDGLKSDAYMFSAWKA